MTRQEHRRLARRVAAADDDDVLVDAKARFDRGRGIMNALAFILFVIIYVERSVSRAAGDDDRARLNQLAAFHPQRVGALVAIERGNGPRYGKACTEFLRLDPGSTGKCLPRNARREAEIVLDLRTGPGLTARRFLFDHGGVQAFGRGIGCCCQTCGAGTDDGNVVNVVGVEIFGQTQRDRDFVIARVRKARPVAVNHGGQRAAGLRMLGEERLGLFGIVGVDPLKRVAVPSKEPRDAQRIAAVGGSRQRHASLIVDEEGGATKDEGAHDDLGDIRLGAHQAREVGARYPADARAIGDAAINQDLTVVEQIEFAGEHARTVGGNDIFACFRQIDDLDRTRQADEKIHAALAALEQICTGPGPFLRAVAADPLELLIGQLRENLPLALIRVGGATRLDIDGRRSGWGWSPFRHRIKLVVDTRNRQPFRGVGVLQEQFIKPEYVVPRKEWWIGCGKMVLICSVRSSRPSLQVMSMSQPQHAARGRSFESYAEFYQNSAYARFDQEHRANGSFGLTMMAVRQDPIDMIDAPMPDFTFQTERIGGGRAIFDIGDGKVVNERTPANTLTVIPAHAEAHFDINYAHDLLIAALPVSQLLPLLEEHGLRTDIFAEQYGVSRTHPGAIAIADEMWRCSELPARTANLYLDGLTLQFLAVVAGQDALSPNGVGRPEDLRVARVIEYIEAHFGEPLAVGELAAIACLSQSHFTRVFKAATGLAVWAYVLERRRERARQQLMTTRKPVVQIAYDCGFANQAHLASVLVKKYGATPGQIRKSAVWLG